MITGWLLVDEEREALLLRFPPLWPDIVAHHVTLDGDAAESDALPVERAGEIVGEIEDGAGLQALVVAIGGTTDRPDGSTYHITWSLDRAGGRTGIQSNEVIVRLGWRALDIPVPITLVPCQL